MKVLALAILVINSVAHAVPTPSREDLILKHPMVFAIEQLMNEKDAGQCVLPTAQDIHWMCTGAIRPVTKPEIDSTGCGFSIDVKCPSQTATIFGEESSYFLNQPEKSAHPIKVAPLSGGTNITSVHFN